MAFRIYGMDCADEVAILRADLAPLSGVQELAFDLLNAKLIVTFDEAKVSPDMTAISKTEMRAEPWQESRTFITKSSGWSRWGRTFMTAASGLFLVAGVAMHLGSAGWQSTFGGQDGRPMPLVARIMYLAAIVAGAWVVVPKAWPALLRLRPDMNLLIVVAVGGAVAIDELSEAATFAFLFAVSLALESWSVGRARWAIAALMSLTPETARVIHADGTGMSLLVVLNALRRLRT